MRNLIFIFIFILSGKGIAQCNFIGLDSVNLEEKKIFKANLSNYIFQKKTDSTFTISSITLEQVKICAKDTMENSIFDYFKTYLPESRKTYLDTIAKLKRPKITHYLLESKKKFKSKEEKIFAVGELFITHKNGILKSRFSVLIWEDKIHLMNLMIPPQ